jgi:hypothetical protein
VWRNKEKSDVPFDDREQICFNEQQVFISVVLLIVSIVAEL